MSTSASVSPSRGAPRPTAAAPEALRRHVATLLASFKPGLALPRAFFCDDTLYAAELEYIFGRHWLFVASEAEIPEGGDRSEERRVGKEGRCWWGADQHGK